MINKIILSVILVVFSWNTLYADDRLIPKEEFDKIIRTQYKIIIVGDAIVGERINEKVNDVMKNIRPMSNITSSVPIISINNQIDFISQITYTPTHGQSIYDLQSNGCAVQLWQNHLYPDQIHAVYMASPYNDYSFVNRRSKYYYSSNRGTSWNFITDVPISVKSGFVTVTGMSDGNILVANHSNFGSDPTRTQVFKDIFPGLGSFINFDPGTGGHNPPPLWPRVIATSNIMNTNKFIVIASSQSDSAFYNIYATSGFTGWMGYNATNAENYAIARGSDGRIGIAYVINEIIFPADAGNVYFMESTNDGTTFCTPLKIFNANFSSTGDSLGALRAVSLVYQNNDPKAAFSIVRQNPSPGTYFPLWPSKCMFWSTTLPGTDPNRSIVVADQNNIWMPQDSLHQGVNDVLCPFDRPVIGVSSDRNALFYALMVITNRAGAPVDSTNFRAIYMTASTDSGATWVTPSRITPEIPVMDWTYPSMTPVSDVDTNYYYVNMVIQKDTIPGSFVQGAANGPSLAQQMFVRIRIDRDSIIVGKKNKSIGIPEDYKLYQNYPNPFNPSTTILFDLSKSTNAKVTIYDVRGKEVATLLNEKLTAGSYKVVWNSNNLSSGVYFYKIVTEEFVDVKKMVLLK